MANRVALDANGLRVSRPGFNVLTTGDANLIFNSNWSQLSLLARGTVVTSGNSGSILYGKTYVNVPLLIFHLNYVDPSLGQRSVQYYNNFAIYTLGQIDFSERLFTVIAANDRFNWQRALAWGTQTVRYSVWDLDL